MGYDVGFVKDSYGCNLKTCKCAHFEHTVIGRFGKGFSYMNYTI